MSTTIPDATPLGTFDAAGLGGRLARLDRRALVFRLATVAVLIYGFVGVDNFGTAANMRALVASIAVVGVCAVGMAFVTIGGSLFMLSVGSTLAFGTIIFAKTLSLGPVPALLITVGAGTVTGVLQGLVVGRWRGDPIITTIGFASLILGVAEIFSGDQTVVARGDASLLQGDIVSFLPVSGAVLIVVAVLAQLLLSRTRFGREVQLTGENREAALLAGIRVRRTTVLTFVLATACFGLAAALLGSQAKQGTLQLGIGTDFDVIAAVVVGGIAVSGGRGSVTDALIGAFFIGLISNVLLVDGASYQTQLMCKGLIVLLAITLAGVGRRLAERSRS